MAEHDPITSPAQASLDEALTSSRDVLIARAADTDGPAQPTAHVGLLEDTAPSSGRRPIEALLTRNLTPKDYAPGRIIAGRYRIERLLGEGAMGIVVAARHLELDELVALKFIRPEVQKDADVTARFAREAKASARIKSEHVVKLLDIGVTLPIGPYIVMEYLEGRDLCDELVASGPMQVPRAVECMLQACEALAAAHAVGVTHRDIKPENLFVIRRGELEVVKLLDFGISKGALKGRVFGDELTADTDTSVMGTPLYMSPEQIQSSEAIDHRTDVWSLGAVLYELVTGVAAFAADDVPKVCARVLYEEPLPLERHLPGAPPALQAVIDRCLAKEPSARYQDIGELSLALVPLAPSRAQLYAEFSTSVLRRSGVGIVSREVAAEIVRGEAPVVAASDGAAEGDVASPLPAPSGASGALPGFSILTPRVPASQRARRVLAVTALCALLGYAGLSFRPSAVPAPQTVPQTPPAGAGVLGAPAGTSPVPVEPEVSPAVSDAPEANASAEPAPVSTATRAKHSAARSHKAKRAARSAARREARASKRREGIERRAKRATARGARQARASVAEPGAEAHEATPKPKRRVRLVRDHQGESDASRVRLVH
jgi:serine/threonine-protein kinase